MKFAAILLLLIVLFPIGALAAGGGGGGGGASIYLSLEPPFVVNLKDDQRIRFLQIKSQLKLEQVEMGAEVKHHMSKIRHVLLMLFSNLSENEVRTLEGKEKLREHSLAAVQSAMEEETGESLVEQIYFTDFIIQ